MKHFVDSSGDGFKDKLNSETNDLETYSDVLQTLQNFKSLIMHREESDSRSMLKSMMQELIDRTKKTMRSMTF